MALAGAVHPGTATHNRHGPPGAVDPAPHPRTRLYPDPMDAPPGPNTLTRGDPLACLLDGPRARGAFMIRACFEPPWAVRVEDRAPLTVMLMARGDALITPDGDGEPVRLRPGDLALPDHDILIYTYDDAHDLVSV